MDGEEKRRASMPNLFKAEPSRSAQSAAGQFPNNMEDDWGRMHMTVIHTHRVHYFIIRYCACLGSEESHIQLMKADLFPATTKEARTVFTFQILNNFI